MQRDWSSFQGLAVACSLSDFVDDLTKGKDHKPDYGFKTNPSQNNGNSGNGNAYGHGK